MARWPTRTLAERFWAKVEKRDSGCWEWIAGTHNGYGVINVYKEREHSSTTHKAHRVAWFLTHGRWPKSKLLHTCDNTRCVRPKHCYEGTQLDNARDRETRGRGNHAKGERHGSARLNETKVRAIRATNLEDKVWAERFGVSISTIQHAREGRT